MKKIICILSIAALLCAMLLCGCNARYGKYRLVSATVKGETYTGDRLRGLGLDPDECYLQLKGGHKAILYDGITRQKMLWNDSQLWPEDSSFVYDYRIDGNQVIVTRDGDQLVFTK